MSGQTGDSTTVLRDLIKSEFMVPVGILTLLSYPVIIFICSRFIDIDPRQPHIVACLLFTFVLHTIFCSHIATTHYLTRARLRSAIVCLFDDLKQMFRHRYQHVIYVMTAFIVIFALRYVETPDTGNTPYITNNYYTLLMEYGVPSMLLLYSGLCFVTIVSTSVLASLSHNLTQTGTTPGAEHKAIQEAIKRISVTEKMICLHLMVNLLVFMLAVLFQNDFFMLFITLFIPFSTSAILISSIKAHKER